MLLAAGVYSSESAQDWQILTRARVKSATIRRSHGARTILRLCSNAKVSMQLTLNSHLYSFYMEKQYCSKFSTIHIAELPH